MKKQILDAEKRAQIITVLSVGGTLALAAKHVGCCRTTIYRTADSDPKFRNQLHEARTSTEIEFLETIKYHGGRQSKCWQAARWALQHMNPDRFARKAFTMPLAEVKDLISQVLAAIADEIRDPKTRAAVRRRIRNLVDSAIRKAKDRARDS